MIDNTQGADGLRGHSGNTIFGDHSDNSITQCWSHLLTFWFNLGYEVKEHLIKYTYVRLCVCPSVLNPRAMCCEATDDANPLVRGAT